MTDFCPTCEKYIEIKTETVKETFTVRGTEIEISVPRKICLTCGEKLGSEEQDQYILDTVNAEYRTKTDLLTSEKIKEIRNLYNLSQKSFALLLGMSEATINRYENGALQDQSHDTSIRSFENPQFVREALERKGHLLTQWQLDRALKSLEGQDLPRTIVLSTGTYMPDEVSEITGFRHFDYERFAYVVIFLCSKMGEICTTVINKLLFYADFLNFKAATVSLTGAAYRRLDRGPVLADYDGLLSKMESEDLLIKEEIDLPNGYTGFYFKPGEASDSVQVKLSSHEEKILAFIAEEFKDYTAKDISERSHSEAAWTETENKALISYLKAVSLSLGVPS